MDINDDDLRKIEVRWKLFLTIGVEYVVDGEVSYVVGGVEELIIFLEEGSFEDDIAAVKNAQENGIYNFLKK